MKIDRDERNTSVGEPEFKHVSKDLQAKDKEVKVEVRTGIHATTKA